MVATELKEGLQVAELNSGGAAAEDLSSIAEVFRGLGLALGVDDLGAPFAFGFGLAGDGALHGLGKLDVFDLHRGDLDAPRLGLVVDDLSQTLVELIALGQQGVEIGAAEHGAQGGLGDLGGGDRVILHLGDGPARVDHAEVGHRVDPHGDVVAGDQLLRGDGEGDGAQINPDHAVHQRDQADGAGSTQGQQPTEAKNHTALVFPQDAQAGDGQPHHRDRGADENPDHGLLRLRPLPLLGTLSWSRSRLRAANRSP